tara:strand:+ start:1259 stop:1429 length:171 start_codon:yes stop_codon:yes gene_type:complete
MKPPFGLKSQAETLQWNVKELVEVKKGQEIFIRRVSCGSGDILGIKSTKVSKGNTV